MDKIQLYIGDKNLSSWSMRIWLLLKHFDLPFTEKVIFLGQDNTKSEISKVSPSGKVPLLVDGDLRVWDSLAIAEYLADKFPHMNIWPQSAKERAWARSLCAEMHSGFVALRSECSMNLSSLQSQEAEISADAKKDLTRIDNAWHLCRETHKAQGPYLFGAFSVADAFYLPVVSRVRTHRLSLKNQLSLAYCQFMQDTPLFQHWLSEAAKEVL